MTGRRRPPGPGRRPRPGPQDDVPQLSEEEVQRRVEVRAGDQPRAPIDRPVRARRPVVAGRPQRTRVRDLLLLLVLAVVGLVALSFLLPDGPLNPVASEAPDGSQAAIASLSGSTTPTVAPLGTPGLVTLPPVILPTVDPAATVAPAPTATPVVATSAPTTSATQKPGTTPKPTPTPTPTAKPTKTPTPTPTKTPTPTAGPSAPTTSALDVTVVVVNDNGGNESPGDWTFFPQSAGSESPASFVGSTSATTVTIAAGKTYYLTSTGPSGYTRTQTTNCSSSTGGLPVGGATESCTITLNDQAPRLVVRVNVSGGSASASDWTVTVTGTNVGPDAQFVGSSAGTVVRFDANASFSASIDGGPADYSLDTTGTCSDGGLAPGADISCTFNFTYVPPPSPAASAILPILPAAPLLAPALLRLRGRRWQTTPASR